MNNITTNRESLRLPAALLLIGQVCYVVVTQMHAGGSANDHHAIFHTYAENTIWTDVHLGQFLSMAILLAGLFALFFALDPRTGIARWTGRFGAALAAIALGLYAVLQAVDGVALKQAVNALASAPEAEETARFAAAEAVRWLEWGMRSYEGFAMGLALLLFAVSILTTDRLSAGVGYLMGLSGVAYLAQGWIAGTEGFTSLQSIAIVLGWLLSVAWMIWLAVAAWGESSADTTQAAKAS